jgi:tripartite-type tricarboxylate transporter receptor subunit TctC
VANFGLAALAVYWGCGFPVILGRAPRNHKNGIPQTGSVSVTPSIGLAFAVVFAALAGWAFPAAAQDYPSRTVTIIVPYPAGGPTDQLARVLAPKFSEQLGQNVIVENVSGGATTIATGRVARAAPDGHLLLLHNLQISANVALHPNLPFDTEKDLAPIAFINHNPLVLVGRKSLAADSLGELIAWMRTTPAKMAHPGTGSTGHLTTALFAQEAKVSVNHIPYRGAAPALQDISGGHVDLFFATPQSVVQAVAAQQMKAYGITAKQKSPQFPGAPSMVQELGPKLEISYWHALLAPAGTPKPVIDKLNAVLQGVMDDPAIVKAWADTGVAPYPKDQRSPQAAQALLRSEIARWGQVVRDNNIQPGQ